MNMRLRIAGALAVASTLIVATPAPGASGAEFVSGEVIPGEVDARSTSRTTGSQLERPEWTNTSCPEITDSITRLYSAFFQRQPDKIGFEFWIDVYASGGWNLDKIARHFVLSDEFVETYGSLNNTEFVDLIYQNVQGRAGEPVGRAFWIEQLDSGQMTRGRVMIFFSESEEYVTSSGTVRPMAGYLGWYPEGTTWVCARGVGSVELPAVPGFTDVLITNFERTDQRYTLVSYDRSFQAPIVLIDNTLASDFYSYYRAREFEAGDGYLELDMAGEMYWVVVNYPTAMVEARDGWT